MYDSQCNMLGAFAGGLETGEQLGVFNKPVAVTLVGSSLWVADYKNNSLTVFEPTEYALLLREAQSLYLRGDYEEAKPLWNKVLASDRGNQLAYRGLAMVSYNDGNYKQAKEYAETALDYSVYDLAWRAIISSFIAKNFLLIILAAALITAAVVCAVRVLHKKKYQFAGAGETEIADPYGRGIDEYNQCFEQLYVLIEKAAEIIRKNMEEEKDDSNRQ